MSALDSSVSEIAARVTSGELSAVEVVTESLARIESRSDLGAFLTTSETVLDEALALDVRRARGERLGPLAGVPVAVKDALCVSGAPTTAGSRALVSDGGSDPRAGWRPPYDATVVARLRSADALIVGKTNLDEFAMGSSTENSAFWPTKNPWDLARTPGGSSGGSAASVSARLTPAALGSDTGGSIRQPAALTGIVGIKPSYGRVSRFGLVAFASSLDQVGPMATDVRGAARLLQAIAGEDPHDSTASSRPVGDLVGACDRGVRGLRIGVPDEYFAEGLDEGVRRSVEAAIEALTSEGGSAVRVRLPHTELGVATYYVIATAEASSNLARFDGVRYGLRVEPSSGGIDAMYRATRGRGFGREVKRRIILGTYVLSAGYYDAYYGRAQQVRDLVRRDFDRAFESVDVILTPTTPRPAFELGAKTSDPLSMYLEDVFTLPASLAGICGASVPCAPVRLQGHDLPVGLQILGPAFGEESVLAVAAAWEALCPPRKPPS